MSGPLDLATGHGPTADRVDSTAVTEATGAHLHGPLDRAIEPLAHAFAAALLSGDRALLRSVIGNDAVYLVPGRSRVGGVHRGIDRVVVALTASAAPGTDITAVDLTEVLCDGLRALVVVAQSGAGPSGRFGFETAFHLQADAGSIVGITEYAGDQYTVDGLIGHEGP